MHYPLAVRVGKGKQYLLLVLSGEGAPTEGNIAYINQAAAGADGSISFNAYPSALTSGTYRVYIVGGSRAFSAGPAATFQVDQKYTLGDVNADDKINIKDVAEVLNHIVKNKTLTGNAFSAADVVTDGVINIKDTAKILNYIVKNITSFN